MHIEALTNQAFASCDLTLICAYPRDPATALAIRQVHPSLLDGAAMPSSDHLPADRFLASYPLPPPSQLGRPQLTRVLDRVSQLPALRQAARHHLIGAGLTTDRGADFVLAVIEVASNAVEHGVPPAAVCLWTNSASVTCQISDNGYFTKPLAGLLPPPHGRRRGRGLWLAYQLCDQLYLWPRPTTIRLHMNSAPSTPS